VQKRQSYLPPAACCQTWQPEAPLLDASGDIGDVGWEDSDNENDG
jgi:hypothetical protein